VGRLSASSCGVILVIIQVLWCQKEEITNICFCISVTRHLNKNNHYTYWLLKKGKDNQSVTPFLDRKTFELVITTGLDSDSLKLELK